VIATVPIGPVELEAGIATPVRPLQRRNSVSVEMRVRIQRVLTVILLLYLFLLSIKLLGHSFKLFGKGFAEAMLQMTADPFIGLVTGIVATSLMQSSSTTTSIVVGMVAGGALTLPGAIPIIMGANIGTTVTNSLVSLGHVTRREEFRRAFSAGVVHDFYNVCAVLVLFPIELKFHVLARLATSLEASFSGAGGLKLFNPLKFLLNPVIKLIDSTFSFLPNYSVILMVVALLGTFAALVLIVRTIRSLVLDKLEVIVQKYLFRNDVFGLVLGLVMTVVVQSSSVTTSLIIPLAGAGIITIRKLFPYTLGANLGTTVTALLAAMATQNHVAVTVAFSHLCFNILGIGIFYPLKFIPIGLAEFVGRKASLSKRNLVLFVIAYFLIYLIPVVFIFAR
jgi:sodium-dependent phosphate cotransporter